MIGKRFANSIEVQRGKTKIHFHSGTEILKAAMHPALLVHKDKDGNTSILFLIRSPIE